MDCRVNRCTAGPIWSERRRRTTKPLARSAKSSVNESPCERRIDPAEHPPKSQPRLKLPGPRPPWLPIPSRLQRKFNRTLAHPALTVLGPASSVPRPRPELPGSDLPTATHCSEGSPGSSPKAEPPQSANCAPSSRVAHHARRADQNGRSAARADPRHPSPTSNEMDCNCSAPHKLGGVPDCSATGRTRSTETSRSSAHRTGLPSFSALRQKGPSSADRNQDKGNE